MSKGMSTFDKVKVVVVAVGGMAGGLFIAHGPQSLRDEIPIHFELGIGLFLFGALMIAALFFVRAKSLVLFVATGLFAVAAGVAAYGAGPENWQFYAFGALAIMVAIFSFICLYSVFSGDDPVD